MRREIGRFSQFGLVLGGVLALTALRAAAGTFYWDSDGTAGGLNSTNGKTFNLSTTADGLTIKDLADANASHTPALARVSTIVTTAAGATVNLASVSKGFRAYAQDSNVILDNTAGGTLVMVR